MEPRYLKRKNDLNDGLIKQGKPPLHKGLQGRNKRSGPENFYKTKGKKFEHLVFLPGKAALSAALSRSRSQSTSPLQKERNENDLVIENYE